MARARALRYAVITAAVATTVAGTVASTQSAAAAPTGSTSTHESVIVVLKDQLASKPAIRRAHRGAAVRRSQRAGRRPAPPVGQPADPPDPVHGRQRLRGHGDHRAGRAAGRRSLPSPASCPTARCRSHPPQSAGPAADDAQGQAEGGGRPGDRRPEGLLQRPGQAAARARGAAVDERALVRPVGQDRRRAGHHRRRRQGRLHRRRHQPQERRVHPHQRQVVHRRLQGLLRRRPQRADERGRGLR